MRRHHGKLYLFGTLKLVAGQKFWRPMGPFEPDQLLDAGAPTTQSLLAYLALHPDQPIERPRLAFLLWPDTSDRAARRNLRQYLHRLRHLLEPLNLNSRLQDLDNNRLLFAPADQLWIDVWQFDQHIAQLPHLLAINQTLPPHILTPLNLYSTGLLPALYDDWLIPIREQWQQRHREFLQTLIYHSHHHQNWSQLIFLAKELLHHYPTHEATHRLLMEAFYRHGERERAVQQYQTCQHLLRQELDVPPMPETINLYHDIRWGVYQPTNTPYHRPDIQPQDSSKSLSVAPTPSAEPFIGRQWERQYLSQAWQQTTLGQGQLVLIAGERGIGKSRLVDEWLQHHPDEPTCLSWRCREFETQLPYQPIIELLSQRRLAILDTTARETFEEALSCLESDGPQLLIHLLTAELAIKTKPLLLFLDDLHWADEATWRCLAYLAGRCGEWSLLIIGTYREGGLSPVSQQISHTLHQRGQLNCLHLSRFSMTETRQLVNALCQQLNVWPHPFDAARQQFIYEESEGHPLFISEMMKCWRHQWRLGPAEPIYELPPMLRQLITSQLTALPKSSRELLMMAAAIGPTFQFATLARVSHVTEDNLLIALEDWLAQGFVRETATHYGFTHHKIRVVAYDGLSRARRQVIHRRLAELLQAELTHPDPDFATASQVADHYQLSDQPQRALPYLLQAGELAVSHRAYQQVHQFGVQAKRLLYQTAHRGGHQSISQRLELKQQLALAYAFTGEVAAARRLIQEVEQGVRQLDDPVRLGRFFQHAAQIYWLNGQIEPASEYAHRGLRLAATVNQADLWPPTWRMVAQVKFAQGAYDDTISHLRDYVTLEAQFPPPADLPEIYGQLGLAYCRVGAWHKAMAMGQRSLALADMSHQVSQVMIAKLYVALIYAAHTVTPFPERWRHCLNLGQQLAPQGNFSGGEGAIGQLVGSLMGRAMVALGHGEAGLRQLDQLLTSQVEVTTKPTFQPASLLLLNHLFIAESYLQTKQPLRAAQYLADYHSDLSQSPDRWLTAVYRRLLAQLETQLPQPDWVSVEQHLLASAAWLRQIRARPDLARTYLALRRLYDRAGQPAWAVDCHFRATTIFEELGMTAELRQAQGQPVSGQPKAGVLTGLPLQGPTAIADLRLATSW